MGIFNNSSVPLPFAIFPTIFRVRFPLPNEFHPCSWPSPYIFRNVSKMFSLNYAIFVCKYFFLGPRSQFAFNNNSVFAPKTRKLVVVRPFLVQRQDTHRTTKASQANKKSYSQKIRVKAAIKNFRIYAAEKQHK